MEAALPVACPSLAFAGLALTAFGLAFAVDFARRTFAGALPLLIGFCDKSQLLPGTLDNATIGR
jgi:hypothetical protein